MRAGRCAICKFYTIRLLIDHSYSTGYVRGYVCNRCNVVLWTIEIGKHRHERYHFIVNGAFVIDVDCSTYHEYLRSPPLARFCIDYRKKRLYN